MPKQYTRQDFITRAVEIHGYLYDYKNVQYTNSHTKICIIDPEYGEFWQTPNAHLNGQNHPMRGRTICDAKRKIGKQEFVNRANLKHGILYDYSKVEYVNCDTPVCIIDPKYGEFWQSPYQHLNSYGNPVRTRASGGKERHIDHIIPLSIVCSRKRTGDKWFKNRPLYIFLDSDINKIQIPSVDNFKKSDLVILNGRAVSASSVRNNYDIIKFLVSRELGVDISEIIQQDIQFVNNYFSVCE